MGPLCPTQNKFSYTTKMAKKIYATKLRFLATLDFPETFHHVKFGLTQSRYLNARKLRGLQRRYLDQDPSGILNLHFLYSYFCRQTPACEFRVANRLMLVIPAPVANMDIFDFFVFLLCILPLAKV